MKTRFVSFILILVTVLTLAAGALAEYNCLVYYGGDDFTYYKVESYKPNGYCYLYDRPSSIYGTNLGSHKNGELVKVLWHESSGWYYVICSNGKEGYIHDYALTPYYETAFRGRCVVKSNKPKGYCYMYDQPSSTYGRNLGRYKNGAVLEIVDWNASDSFAKVYSPSTKKYGYIRKTSLSVTSWY